ncbi:nucleoside triphosphate pyrophosphohydrolase [Aliikangiella maris]|uniref:Nucleoside triphosphate pyrophosphohydrolase n=2 Tax=Aliikangiella maris TaxID=3162458 RepID=A0ABV3MKR5_9GAMM
MTKPDHSQRLLAQVNEKQGIEKLLAVMSALRDPQGGCEWDLKQNYATIVPFTIEEVYEVVEAIETNDFESLKGELGDLLFQIVFYAQLAKEEGRFDFQQIAEVVSQKLVSRHPHVFSDASFSSESELSDAWEKHKQQERQQRNKTANASMLDDIPKALPELKRAHKLQKRAAKAGFDWSSVDPVWEKLTEESLEVKQAAESAEQDKLEEEIGDLLFTAVNLARHYRVDADLALRKANHKFEARFRTLEKRANKPLTQMTLAELDEIWNQAKASLSETE